MERKLQFFAFLIVIGSTLLVGCIAKEEPVSFRDPVVEEAAMEARVEEEAAEEIPGTDIEARDDNGRTALIRAAAAGDTVETAGLLSQGADLFAVDSGGQTAYDLAVAAGNIEIEQILLRVGEIVDGTFYVNSEDGLRLRDNPGLDSDTITVLPNRAELSVKRRSFIPVTIGDFEGRWSEIEWDGTTGWLF
ncbi:MAG: ankyrin repeat domain-containing protein, partial [Spirochaetia bacterium]